MDKKRDMPRAMRAWKDETGEQAIDMHTVAAWAVAKGWPLPVPQSPLAILAKPFADAGASSLATIPIPRTLIQCTTQCRSALGSSEHSTTTTFTKRRGR